MLFKSILFKFLSLLSKVRFVESMMMTPFFFLGFFYALSDYTWKNSYALVFLLFYLHV